MRTLNLILPLFVGFTTLLSNSVVQAFSSDAFSYPIPVIATCDLSVGQSGLRFYFLSDLSTGQKEQQANLLLASIDSTGNFLGIVGLYSDIELKIESRNSLRLKGSAVLPIPVGSAMPFEVQLTNKKSGGEILGKMVTCKTSDIFPVRD